VLLCNSNSTLLQTKNKNNMKRKITLVLNLCLAMSLMAQPKFGTGPAGVGNEKGDNGQLPNSMWFKADKEKYFTLEGDNSTIKNWHDASGNGNSLIAKIGKPANYTATLKGAPSLTKDSWGAYTVNFGTTGDASRSLYIDDLASEKTQIEGNNGLYLCAVAKRNYVPTSNTTEEFKAIIEKRFEQDPYTNRSYVFQFDGGSGNFNEIQITLNYGTTYTYF